MRPSAQNPFPVPCSPCPETTFWARDLRTEILFHLFFHQIIMTKYPRLAALTFGIAIALAASTSVWAADDPAPQKPSGTGSKPVPAFVVEQPHQRPSGTGHKPAPVHLVDLDSQPSAPIVGASETRADAHASTGPVKSYSALAADIDYHSSMRSLTLPSSAIGAVVASATGCVGNYVQQRQLGFNAVAWLDAGPRTDAACQMGALATQLRAACQFKSAALVEARQMALLVPGQDWQFLVAEAPENLSPQACAALIKPRLVLDGRLTGVE